MTKKYRQRGRIRPFLLCVGIPLLILCGLALLLWAAQTSAEPDRSPVTDAPPSGPVIPNTIDLGQGLSMTEMISAAGVFPEDGKNTVLPDMFCITVKNSSDKTLRLAHVKLTVNGEEYLFQFSTLPAGASVRAYEIHQKAAPTDIKSFQSECVFADFFDAEPSIPRNELEISVTHKGIRVKNLTDKDIDRDILIYYKSIQNDVYVGGITYRIRLSGLKAGDEATVYADHAAEAYTRVMFIEYVE
jgi:hypothetical protein